jgi:hypothetical protein
MKERIPLQAVHLVAIIFVVLCFQLPTFAQNYKVGVFVCDTISARLVSHGDFGPCDPFDYLWFGLSPSLNPYATGLSFQMVFTEIKGRVWSSLSDTVKAGDVLPLSAPGDSGIIVFFATSSSFRFYCEIKEGITTKVCANSWIFYGDGPICQVQPAAAVEDKGNGPGPARFQLLQNYPNPFNAATTIVFDLARPSAVSLKILNLKGEEVVALIHQKQFAAGRHKINWHAEKLPSGIYVYGLQTWEGVVAMRKLVLLK